MGTVLMLLIWTIVYFVLWAGLVFASTDSSNKEKKIEVLMILFVLLIVFSISYHELNGKVLYTETDLYIKGETEGYEVHSLQRYDECIEYGGQFESFYHKPDSDEYLLYVSGYKSGYRKYRTELLEGGGI